MPLPETEHAHYCVCGEAAVTDCTCVFHALQGTCERHRRFNDPDDHRCPHCDAEYNQEEIFCRCGEDISTTCDVCAVAPASAFHRHVCPQCSFASQLCRRDDAGIAITNCTNCAYLRRLRGNPRPRNPYASGFTREEIAARTSAGTQWMTAEGGEGAD